MKLIIFILILFIIPSTIAADFNITAGQSYTLGTIENCDETIYIDVEGALRIDTDEFNLTNCSMKWSDSNHQDWRCSCDILPFIIILNTNIRAINNYTFNISYYTTETTSTPSSGGGGGGGYTIYKKKITLNITNRTVIRNKTIEPTIVDKVIPEPVVTLPIEETEENITVSEPTEDTKSKLPLYFWLILGILIIGILVVLYYKYR